MKTINYVLLFIGMIGFTTCSPKTTDVEPAEKGPLKIWDKTLGGIDFDYVRDIISTSDGGFIVAGDSYSDISGNKTTQKKGEVDVWIVKINKNGEKLWERTFGGSEYETVSSVIETSDGGLIIACSSTSGISGDKSDTNNGIDNVDYWIIKIDANGKKIWDKTFGGNKADYVTSVIASPDGGYIIAGSSNSDISGDKMEANRGKYNDYWIIKIDDKGQKIWDKVIGGDNNDNLTSLIASNDGGFILLGTSSSNISREKSQANLGGLDYWIVKINNKGIKLWDKVLGSQYMDEAEYITSDNNGDYIITGSISYGEVEGEKGHSVIYVVKVNNLGEILWKKTLGGNPKDRSFAGNIVALEDNSIVICGHTTAQIGGDKTEGNRGGDNLYNDYWILKIKKDGQKQWDKTIGGSKHDTHPCIAKSLDGGFVIAGTSASNISGDKTENSKGNSDDYWLVKLGFQ